MKSVVGMKRVLSRSARILHDPCRERHPYYCGNKEEIPSHGGFNNLPFYFGAHTRLYGYAGASAISVLCDREIFRHSLHDLRKARLVTQKTPLLCKDFIIDEYQIYEARNYVADAILLIAAILTEKADRSVSQTTRTRNGSSL